MFQLGQHTDRRCIELKFDQRKVLSRFSFSHFSLIFQNETEQEFPEDIFISINQNGLNILDAKTKVKKTNRKRIKICFFFFRKLWRNTLITILVTVRTQFRCF